MTIETCNCQDPPRPQYYAWHLDWCNTMQAPIERWVQANTKGGDVRVAPNAKPTVGAKVKKPAKGGK